MVENKEANSKDIQLSERERSIRQMHEKQVYMQYKFINDLINYLKPAFGDEIIHAITAFMGERRRKEIQGVVERRGANSIEDLIKVVWEPLKYQGYEFTEEILQNGVRIHVSKCPGVEKAKEWGFEENAYHIICASDPYIVEGFNPQIGFKRTKTLMQGHDCCDHCYFIKE